MTTPRRRPSARPRPLHAPTAEGAAVLSASESEAPEPTSAEPTSAASTATPPAPNAPPSGDVASGGIAPDDVAPGGAAENAAPSEVVLGAALGDALADLVGGALLADPGAAAWRDARFVDWLAAEARAADRPARRTSDAAFLARGEAMLARAQARRLGVHRYPAPAAGAPAPRRVREAAAAPAAGRAVPVVELGVAAGTGRELWDEPPARWLRLPDELPEARYLALRVVGTSMAPMLRSGDVVLVRADARGREPRAGRVVVARHPEDGYLCKRVDAVGARRLVLGSLEPGHAPVVLPRDPALVVGTVVAAWPGR